jgi:hypothetical protein
MRRARLWHAVSAGSACLRLDQALGAVEEAISPRLPVPALSAERRLAEPVGRIEDVEQLLLALAMRLKPGLERRGVGARVLEYALFRVDGAVYRLCVGASRPVRDPETVVKLFRERLAAVGDELDAGYGFDLVRLSVLADGEMPDDQGDFSRKRARPTIPMSRCCSTASPRGSVRARSWTGSTRFRGRWRWKATSRNAPRSAGPRPNAPDVLPANQPRRRRAGAAAFPAGAGRGRCRSTGRAAAALPLAARALPGDEGRGAGAHRRRVVGRRCARGSAARAARLLPRRGRGRAALLAVPARALRSGRRGARRNGSCTGCSPDGCLQPPGYAELAAASNFSFLRGASHPEELAVMAKRLGLSGPRPCRPQHGRRHGARAYGGEGGGAFLPAGRAAGLSRRDAGRARLSEVTAPAGAISAGC